MTWKGEEFHRFSLPFYQEIAHRLSIKIDYPSPVYKLFNEKAQIKTGRRGRIYAL